MKWKVLSLLSICLSLFSCQEQSIPIQTTNHMRQLAFPSLGEIYEFLDPSGLSYISLSAESIELTQYISYLCYPSSIETDQLLSNADSLAISIDFHIFDLLGFCHFRGIFHSFLFEDESSDPTHEITYGKSKPEETYFYDEALAILVDGTPRAFLEFSLFSESIDIESLLDTLIEIR